MLFGIILAALLGFGSILGARLSYMAPKARPRVYRVHCLRTGLTGWCGRQFGDGTRAEWHLARYAYVRYAHSLGKTVAPVPASKKLVYVHSRRRRIIRG